MKKTWKTILIALLAVLVLAGCSPAEVETTPLPSAAQPSGVIAEGRLVPAATQEQSFDLSGRVAEVLVGDGEAVSSGQPLARLTLSVDAEAALARAAQEELSAQQALDALMTNASVHLANSRLAVVQAQQALDAAQADFDAEQSDVTSANREAARAGLALARDTLALLDDSDGVSPQELAAAEARLAAAQASLKSAQALIDAHTLKAGMGGTLIDLELLPGQSVAAGAAVMTIADLSGWVVKTDNLTEMEVVDLQVGQKVTVVVDALPDARLDGEVTHINARYEEKRGDITYTVAVKLNQADPRLRWGMTAAVQFAP